MTPAPSRRRSSRGGGGPLSLITSGGNFTEMVVRPSFTGTFFSEALGLAVPAVPRTDPAVPGFSSLLARPSKTFCLDRFKSQTQK